MPVKKLIEFLDSNKVKYVIISHSTAYTAQDIAAMTKIPGKELAKTVMVKLDGKMAMAILPASYKVNFDYLKKSAGVKKVELATEKEFKEMFPECDTGAMPPFGNLYNLDVYSTESLAEDEEIVFNAGSHTELIRMAYKDFEQLVKPKVMKFSTRK